MRESLRRDTMRMYAATKDAHALRVQPFFFFSYTDAHA